MSIQQRAYRGQEDWPSFCSIVYAFPENNFHVIDFPYRLCSFSLEDERNVAIWEDDSGNVVAFAIWQVPFAVLDYSFHPALKEQDIERRILTWAMERFRQVAQDVGRPLNYYVDVREEQTERRALLQQEGFAQDDWHVLHMTRPLAQPVSPQMLPSSFVIRPLAGEHEVEAYVALHRAAFETNNMTVAWRRRTLDAPGYVPELDLVIEAPDGRLAAFCICWLHTDMRSGRKEGQFEPVGTHPDFQQLGLGRAILLEGFRRLQAFGADIVHVETYNFSEPAQQLYKAVGFHEQYKVLKYGKEY